MHQSKIVLNTDSPSSLQRDLKMQPNWRIHLQKKDKQTTAQWRRRKSSEITARLWHDLFPTHRRERARGKKDRTIEEWKRNSQRTIHIARFPYHVALPTRNEWGLKKAAKNEKKKRGNGEIWDLSCSIVMLSASHAEKKSFVSATRKLNSSDEMFGNEKAYSPGGKKEISPA